MNAGERNDNEQVTKINEIPTANVGHVVPESEYDIITIIIIIYPSSSPS